MQPPQLVPTRRLLAWSLVLVFAALPIASPQAQTGTSVRPNYELAADWTTQKVGRLVFDTTVTPRWLESPDRFWYSYQTREGRKFYLVDAIKKAKTPLFDHAKMAALLTSITRQPYDAQHLPFTTVKFVKKDAAFQFDVPVPRDAEIAKPAKPITTEGAAADAKKQGPRAVDDEEQQGRQQQRGQRGSGPGGEAAPPKNKTLHFEYELATGNLELLDADYKAPRKPRWASISPDEKTIVFARHHNLFMMDAASYALAQKKADDPAIVETELTKDGEEHYSFARTVLGGQEQQEQQQDDQTTDTDDRNPNARVPAITIIWSKDSRKFAVVRRDQRKVADLWVINALAQPRPKLETYRYAMPGEANITLPEICVFDIPDKSRVKINADRFKDQTVSIATARGQNVGGGGGGQNAPDQPEPQWLSPS
ncbi:MAG: DPP IV N-terminal domain-containing protein, partial [Acidobacteria bacterium]|nr:DPP IV N-terminal domain-containing protein [Acidobacteriota bacterium]